MVYDLIVLGGGPGGYIAAERAGGAGLKTLLLEPAALGGTCLNEGCIPSKTLLNSAKIYHHTTEYGIPFGINAKGAEVDQAAVIRKKEQVIKNLVSGVAAAMKAHHVEVRSAAGTILGRKDGLIQVKADGELLSCKNLIIATGSRTVIPPIPGLDEGLASGFVLTSREALALTELPKKMVVIGAGVIGMELATYYQTVGTEVTVLEALPKIAGPVDAELSAMLQKDCEKAGMKFVLGAKAARIEADGVVWEKDGAQEKLLCDKVLLAVGRKSVSDTCGAENLRIRVEKGAIPVDACCRTNIMNVYAVGDCTGLSMLAHSAYRMGEVAVNTILGKKDRFRTKAIPSVLYTNPEIACIGLTEEQAKERNIDYALVRLPMAYSGRFLAETDRQNGLAKFLFDKQSRTLIGAHVMGSYASEFILTCGIMIEKEMTVDAIREIVFPHPSVSEIIREAAFAVSL